MSKTLLRSAAPVLLAAYFSAAAVYGVSARYGLTSVLAVAALYLLLSLALVRGAAFLARLGPLPRWLGAFAVAFSAVWHFREQTFLPGSIAAAVLLAAVLSVPGYLTAARLFAEDEDREPRSARSVLAGAVVAGLGFAALGAAAYHAAPLVRWHLLRHNTMLGTPAYYALDRSVASRMDDLFAAHRPPGSEEGAPRDPPPAAETAPAPAGEAAPNLVFVLIDTLRADALAAHGGDPDLMPNLNRFFAGAHRFTDVVASSSWTRPSVASFFTGLLPEEHGARQSFDPLAEDHVTLAEVLSARGYRTAAFVTNVAAINREFGFDQGFDDFYEFQDLPYARAEKVKRAVSQWLAESFSADDRWFLYLHFLDPHEPYLAGVEPRRKRPDEYRRAYREELRYLDRELGEIFEALQRELPAPTWFFVTSDHGEEFFEHELFGHGYTLYEEVVRIPAALHTDAGSGTDVTARLEARDFFELLLDAALGGGEKAIAELAAERSRERRYMSLYNHTEGRLLLRPYLRRMCSRAVEEDGYKLIWSAYGDTYELYRLEDDPGETVNLAGEEPERVARMAAAFDGHVEFWSFAESRELSEEARERLKALGYLN
jgi:arylsulfatase A-like enzyme